MSTKKKSKKIQALIKLQIKGGGATPAPPVGPALGQRGVPIKQFCDAFNEATADKRGDKLPVIIYVFEDKSFEFTVKEPPASYLIMKFANLKKGSSEPGKQSVGTITLSSLRDIASTKIKDMNARDIDSAISMLAGTAVSMGLEVKED